MAETKLLLEEKVQSVEKKLMDYGKALNSLSTKSISYLLMYVDDMCVDNASYKVQLDSINEVFICKCCYKMLMATVCKL